MESNSTLFLQVFGLFCAGIFILVFLGGGIYLIYRSIKDKKKAKLSLSWPSTPGRVIESRVVESHSSDSDGDTTTTYRPYIKYEYQVVGATFTSDKLSIGPAVSTSNYRKSQDKVNRMPAGSTVTVFYNPDDPTDAVLEQRSNATLMLVLGIVFTVIGLCFLFPGAIIMAVNWLQF
jgi:hypothetical protein